MWVYVTYYPYGIKNTFSIDGVGPGRANQIFNGQNIHPHRNNGTTHKGYGTGAPTKDSYQDRAIKDFTAVQTLPNAHWHNSPYIEAVWNPPAAQPGTTRLIYNKNDMNEIYFTDDHYNVYWKVWATEKTPPICWPDD